MCIYIYICLYNYICIIICIYVTWNQKAGTLIGNRIFQHDGIDIHSAIALASNPLEMVFVVFGYLNGLDVCCCMCWTQWQWKKTMKNLHFTDFTDDCPIQPSCASRIFQPATVDPRPKPLRWILRCDGSAGAKKMSSEWKAFRKLI